MGAETSARPPEAWCIPFVQLPLDLQNRVRANESVEFMLGSLNRGRTGALAIGFATLIATAAMTLGAAGALMYPALPFREPMLWIPLIAGALGVGAIFGHHARLDVRQYGIRGVIVGSTTVILIDRDSVTVLPAEHVTVEAGVLRLSGHPVEHSLFTSDLTDAVADANRVAADASARATDRWRIASGVAVRSPVWRYMSVAHGAALGVTLAVALEAGAAGSSTEPSDWTTLETRAAKLDESERAKLTHARDARRDAALTGDDSDLLAYLRSTKEGEEDATLARAELGRRVATHVGDVASIAAAADLVRLAVAAQLGDAVIGPARDRYIAIVRESVKTLELDEAAGALEPSDDQLALTADMRVLVGRRADALFAAAIAQTRDADPLADIGQSMKRADSDGVLFPKSQTALAAAARRLLASARTLDDVDALAAWVTESTAVDRAYASAFHRELDRVEDLDALRELSNRMQDLNVKGVDAAIGSRARTMFGSALVHAQSPEALDALGNYTAMLGGDSDAYGAQVQARGRVLALNATTVHAALAWLGTDYLSDDDTSKVIQRAGALARRGTLAEARAFLATSEADQYEQRDQVVARVDGLCKRAYAHVADDEAELGRLAIDVCSSGGEQLAYAVDGTEHLGEMAAEGLAADLRALAALHGLPSEVAAVRARADWQVRVEVTYEAAEHDQAERKLRLGVAAPTFACEAHYTRPTGEAWISHATCSISSAGVDP